MPVLQARESVPHHEVAATFPTKRPSSCANDCHVLSWWPSASPLLLLAMKIYLIYDDNENVELHHKLAITLPSKWLEQSADKVKELFCERYNKKFPENELDDEELVLCVKDDSPFTNRAFRYLTSADTPGKCFVAGAEVRLVPPPKQAKPGMTANGKMRCKNFGCQMEYDEHDNPEGCCAHHAEPPVFHDTKKWWGCCADVKVYEFEELMAIPGCVHSKHSNETPAIEVARQAAIAKANAAALEKFDAMASAQGEVRSDGSAPPPKQNIAAAQAAPKPRPKVRPKLAEGYARCKHYGCQIDYKIASNGPNSCNYHSEAPVFHEGAKKWTCCGVVKFDFDDFLAVPGCCTGPHEPVIYDDDPPSVS